MSAKVDLKEMWARKDSKVPTETEIKLKAAMWKRHTRNKAVLAVSILLATIVFILFVWLNADFEMLSTRVGVTIIIVGISLGVVYFTKSAFLLSEVIPTSDNHAYLHLMLKAKQQENFMQTRLVNNYFALLSVGFIFFLYEPTAHMTYVNIGIAYALTLGWIAFNWFYLRPRIIEKQRKKMKAVIDSLQGMSRSLAAPE